jgi:hypothetical protein
MTTRYANTYGPIKAAAVYAVIAILFSATSGFVSTVDADEPATPRVTTETELTPKEAA